MATLRQDEPITVLGIPVGRIPVIHGKKHSRKCLYLLVVAGVVCLFVVVVVVVVVVCDKKKFVF